MYITRTLSEYWKNPSELTQPPPEGPNSGILVIQDQDLQTRVTCCFRSCLVTNSSLTGLPLPQNLKLAARFNYGEDDGTRDPVLFIPILDKPLSSNRYYAINRRGKRSGEAPVSGKEEDRVPFCFCLSYVPEAKSKQLDPYDIYQQFEINRKN
ncbi:unnamed protein product [Arabis nemorensis]|uniref:Uncharacterized protein n=1 Tax=Arabis nemorensis TaxID=586526 RepID=A0A565AP80_9BRAS|nr:unnamed protein product [Arabis nemorensis]